MLVERAGFYVVERMILPAKCKGRLKAALV